jgi:hypothetical protein
MWVDTRYKTEVEKLLAQRDYFARWLEVSDTHISVYGLTHDQLQLRIIAYQI